MKYSKQLGILVPVIAIMALTESLFGIFSNDGSGAYWYKSIRNEMVQIYGRGVYRHMTTDVAVQGIAQDYVTLFLAIPLLFISFFQSVKGSVKWKMAFLGVLLYFLLTYMFYIGIAMYNEMFLVAVATLFSSLFAFILNLISFDFDEIKNHFENPKTLKRASIFLIFVAVMMALLWFSVIIPPMLDGSFYPKGLAHYSTLIVQGYDLGIFLPLALISGILGLQKHPFSYVLIPTYLVFLSVLLSALLSKIIFMANVGANVIPVIFIIPVLLVLTLFNVFQWFKGFKS